VQQHLINLLISLALLTAPVIAAPHKAVANIVATPNYLKTIKPLPTLDPTSLQPAQPMEKVVQSYSDVAGQNTLRDYIFSVESGGSLGSVNPGGCIGLGQDCNHWMETGRLNSPVCPNWQTDLDCQLAYWDWYANTIYGGWGPSYAFRSTHNYW
jgi:hypothetical protein